MGTLTCETVVSGGESKNKYSCSGIGCGRKIKKLKQQDAANPNSAVHFPVSEFKVLDMQPGMNDAIFVGAREFSVFNHDVIISKLDNDVVDVVVFDGEEIIFREKRPKATVRYAVGRCHEVSVFEAFEDEKDFMQLDVRDVNERYLKLDDAKPYRKPVEAAA